MAQSQPVINIDSLYEQKFKEYKQLSKTIAEKQKLNTAINTQLDILQKQMAFLQSQDSLAECTRLINEPIAVDNSLIKDLKQAKENNKALKEHIDTLNKQQAQLNKKFSSLENRDQLLIGNLIDTINTDKQLLSKLEGQFKEEEEQKKNNTQLKEYHTQLKALAVLSKFILLQSPANVKKIEEILKHPSFIADNLAKLKILQQDLLLETGEFNNLLNAIKDYEDAISIIDEIIKFLDVPYSYSHYEKLIDKVKTLKSKVFLFNIDQQKIIDKYINGYNDYCNIYNYDIGALSTFIGTNSKYFVNASNKTAFVSVINDGIDMDDKFTFLKGYFGSLQKYVAKSDNKALALLQILSKDKCYKK
jgi:predicted  nucleic acid-binding Zn-ribbon protein